MTAENQAEVDFLKELFLIDDLKARQMIREKAFFNPISGGIIERHTLLSGNVQARAERIIQWIHDTENHSSYVPSYDDRNRYYLVYAEETLSMINRHIKLRNKAISEMKKKDPQDTSLMKQFEEMKARHPDAILLFRRNDSYEIFRQDALKAKSILGLDMESREIGGVKTDVIGFKHHSLDMYLPKLVRAGMRIAICEQLEDPKQKKAEKDDVSKSNKETPRSKSDETQLTNTTMPRKKKEKTPEQEQPKAKAEAKTEVKAETKAEVKTESKAEKKQEVKSEQKQEAQQERKPREPQMVTVNGDKVTHGHAFQGKDSQDWYFTAKINGEQLKPQKMDPADLAAYQKKEMTVPQLMERYYPTKLMPKVPEVSFKTPNVLAGPEGNITIDKFNVYKEKDEKRPDFGKYKFYAQIGENKMSTVASRQDLNAYFDRVMTPGQLVEKNFGERLHLSSHYQQFRLPEGVENEQIRIAKDRSDGKWKVSVDLGERGKTDKKELSFDDGYSLYKTKTATREQIAAKYVGNEVRTLLAAPAMKMEKSASVKMRPSI